MINENNKSNYENNIHIKDKSLNSISKDSKDSNLKVQNIQNITIYAINLSKNLNERLSKTDKFTNFNDKEEKVKKIFYLKNQ